MATEIVNGVSKHTCPEKKEDAIYAANQNAMILAGLTISDIKGILETQNDLPSSGPDGCAYLVRDVCKLFYYGCGQWNGSAIANNAQFIIPNADGTCEIWAKAKGIISQIKTISPTGTVLVNDPTLPVNDPNSPDFDPLCTTLDSPFEFKSPSDTILVNDPTLPVNDPSDPLFDPLCVTLDSNLPPLDVKPPKAGSIALVSQDATDPNCVNQLGLIGGSDIGIDTTTQPGCAILNYNGAGGQYTGGSGINILPNNEICVRWQDLIQSIGFNISTSNRNQWFTLTSTTMNLDKTQPVFFGVMPQGGGVSNFIANQTAPNQSGTNWIRTRWLINGAQAWVKRHRITKVTGQATTFTLPIYDVYWQFRNPGNTTFTFQFLIENTGPFVIAEVINSRAYSLATAN